MAPIIKFRVWQGTSFKYIENNYDLPYWNGDASHGPKNTLTNMNWEQFIVKYDKKGKEIYVNDIILINHPDDVTGDFTNSYGRVFYWDDETGFYHGNSGGRPPKRMWEYCEVIGNIYQTPQFLPKV